MRILPMMALCTLPLSAPAQPLELPTDQTLDWLVQFFQGSTSIVQETADSQRHFLYVDLFSTRVMFAYDERDDVVTKCFIQYIDLSVTEGIEHWSDEGCDGVLDEYGVQHTHDGEWILDDDVTGEQQQQYERLVEFYASNLNLFWNMVNTEFQKQAVAQCRRDSAVGRQKQASANLKTVRTAISPGSTLSLQVHGRDSKLFQYTFTDDAEKGAVVYGERTPIGEVRVYDMDGDGFVDEMKQVQRTGKTVITFPLSITVARPVFECAGLHRLEMTAALAENLTWFFAE